MMMVVVVVVDYVMVEEVVGLKVIEVIEGYLELLLMMVLVDELDLY